MRTLLVLTALSVSVPAFADDAPAAPVTSSPALDGAVDAALDLELESDFADDGACQRRRRRNRSGGGGGSAGGSFGLGLQLGWPTGLTGYFGLGGGQALQFAVGVGGGAFLVASIDYIIQVFQLVNASPGRLGLYIGGGAWLGLFGATFVFLPVYAFPFAVGLEVPFGLRWRFHRLPLDLYGEIAPVVSVLPGLGFGFKGAIGLRFYF